MFMLCVMFVLWHLAATAENDVLYIDGWIPMRNDIVYDQIKRERDPLPPYIATHNIQSVNTNIQRVLPPQNKLKIEGELRNDHIDNSATRGTDNRQSENATNDFMKQEYENIPNVVYVVPTESGARNKSARSSRNNSDFKDHVQHLLVNVNNMSAKTNDRTYEVKEKMQEDTFEHEESKTFRVGYKYEVPKRQNETGAGLYDILSKYKINKDDKLTNYKLSRQQKSVTPHTQNLLLKPPSFVPARTSIFLNKSNNPNHLPLDPLLAVFLSNYGFYLRGMYGIHNQYNNLYGYLASNNIHNNRPFGTYKIFSDTDSSH